MSHGEIIIRSAEDGRAGIQLRAVDAAVWLTQAQMAALFGTTRQNVSRHLRNILSEGELAEESVVKDSLTTAADAKACRSKLYSLDAILAVGCRMRPPPRRAVSPLGHVHADGASRQGLRHG